VDSRHDHGAGDVPGLTVPQIYRLAVGYSLNRYWPALALGDRARALIDAVYRSL
jgi:hypothetical protein